MESLSSTFVATVNLHSPSVGTPMLSRHRHCYVAVPIVFCRITFGYANSKVRAIMLSLLLEDLAVGHP